MPTCPLPFGGHSVTGSDRVAERSDWDFISADYSLDLKVYFAAVGIFWKARQVGKT